MKPAERESLYQTLARMSGLALILTSVFFQRRGLMHWTELVFLGACVGLQETFLRLPRLRRWRTPMLMAYSAAPLGLILAHEQVIRAHAGDLVGLVLYTPLPLVLVSVQIMVLYVRDAPRLVSVVLVLALFSTVIGVRRPLDDVVWPWLAGIAGLSAVFLALQHPGMLYHGVYTRRAHQPPPAARPGGIMRRSFVSTLPLLAMSTVFASLLLYFAAPRIEFDRSQGDILGRNGTAAHDDASTAVPPPNRSEPSGDSGRPRDPASVAGLSDGVDLGDFGEILKTGTPALEVRPLFSDPPQSLYLRAFTYAMFEGVRWKPLSADGSRISEVPEAPSRSLPGAPLREGSGYRTRAYELKVLESGLGRGGVVPLPVEAQAVHDYGGPLIYDRIEHTLRGPALKQGDTLRIDARQSVIADQVLARRLHGRGPSRDTLPIEYRTIPDELKHEIAARFSMYEDLRTDALAIDRSRPQHGVFAAANRIVRMFKAAKVGDQPAWTYDLDRRPAPGWDSIARFLDTSIRGERTGHCEYFASAMCALLRCYGVPCRLAAGFAAKSAELDGAWHVTSRDAHAWVEVYFDELGWLAFDPTPAAPADPAPDDYPLDATAADQQPVEQPQPEAEPAAESRDWFRDFGSDDQKRLYADTTGAVINSLASADGALLAATSWMPQWLPGSGFARLLILVLPVNALALLLLLRRRRRRKLENKVLKDMGISDKRHDRGLYFRLLLLLARYGYHKRPSETPREFARRIIERGGGMHERIIELTEIYYALRFGGNQGLATEFMGVLRQYADALKAAIRPGEETAGETTATP